MKALLHENVALAPLTTFGIGGAARYFIEARTEEAAADAIQFAKDKKLPLFILGGGSNLLVADAGFSGLVVKIGIKGIDFQNGGAKTFVRSGAGEEWDRIVALCVERKLGGVECLSGIPGSAGGTPVQNVGAYGQEVSEVLTSVRVYDRQNDRVMELSREDCGFAYRTSRFNTIDKDRFVIMQVTYALANDGAASIRYPDVQREFDGKNSAPSLDDVRTAVRRIRARKAMLLVEGDPDCLSAGSFFKNPVLTESQFASLEAIAGPALPRYPAGPGKVKTAAAWLIERAGFSKGYTLGPAGLSSKHTLAIINKGGAKAEDILRLAKAIESRVRDQFGITLVPEPVFLGFATIEG